jgi:hypothetical protein
VHILKKLTVPTGPGSAIDSSRLEEKRSRRVYPPGVLQKSAEATDAKRVGEKLFFEECGRV